MSYDITSGLRLRLIDFDSQPWDSDINENFRLIGSWYDGTASPALLGYKNVVVNGSFNIWQRGTVFTATTGITWTADRWGTYFSGTPSNTTVTQKSTLSDGIGTLLALGCLYYAEIKTTTVGTETLKQYFTNIENVHIFSNSTVTLSFVAWSPDGAQLGVVLQQVFGTGGSPSAVVTTSQQFVTLTSTPTLYTMTFSLASTVGKTLGSNNNDRLAITFLLTVGANTYNISAVTLEKGTVASGLPFLPQATELLHCMRYYETSFVGAPTGFTAGLGAAYGFDHFSGFCYRAVKFAVPKRKAPTVTLYDAIGTSNRVSIYNGTTWVDNINPVVVTLPQQFSLVHTTAGSIATEFGFTALSEVI